MGLYFYLHMNFYEVTIMVFSWLVLIFPGHQTKILFYLHLCSLVLLGQNLFPLLSPSSILASGLLLLWSILVLYFSFYGLGKIPFSWLSAFFFSLNILLPLSLILTFGHSLFLDSLVLKDLSFFSLGPSLLLLFLLPFLWIFFYSGNNLPFSGGTFSPGESIHVLWKNNPLGDRICSRILTLGQRIPSSLGKLVYFIHIFLLLLLPLLHSLLWFWVFWDQDLLPLLRGLPLLLLSFFYAHGSHYFSS